MNRQSVRGAAILSLVLALAPLCAPARAQSSSSYRLDEHVLNAGGHPRGGTTMRSASFALSLDSIGDPLPSGIVSSQSFAVDGGFVGPHAPPGEVSRLRFDDAINLRWDPAFEATSYHLYRGDLPTLDDGSYGQCQGGPVAGTSTFDVDVPAPGQGRFYLITARNSLFEESSKGRDGDGTPRTNPDPCPGPDGR